jgi:hypothetical protein
MKTLLLFILVLLTACGGRQKDYRPAENALDAGREFINACLQGDFSRAAFFMLPGSGNEQKLKEIERGYREKDKEGRQQYRQASININEVSEIAADTTVIKYSNSFDKIPETIRVVRQNGNWLVDMITVNPAGH